jgi:hypothetical protein
MKTPPKERRAATQRPQNFNEWILTTPEKDRFGALSHRTRI